MRVIARRTLREFVAALAGRQDQPAVKVALDAWFDEVKKARWRNTADVKRSYATASIVTADRIVFNVKGNAYRLVVAVDFDRDIVWIKWIGTHRDYDRIDVTEVEHAKRTEAHSDGGGPRGGARRGGTPVGRDKRHRGR
ncbi:MAG TPA: type II toxin-antitoxin system HigB family toxin [Acetobacteraceae bacterium]|jgi:mRNA interferase HigB